MSLMTLFSAPKPFTDPLISIIQSNAVLSWSKLHDVEILLMGEELGIDAAAARVGARHITGVRRNSSGTPLVSSMIELARHYGTGELLCIVNADMIIMQDLLDAAIPIKNRWDAFVLAGRRWDVSIESLLDFKGGWEAQLRHYVLQKGEIHRPAGSDFFVFPHRCYAATPDFAVGRAGWDNWMIYEARRHGWPVVDCTPSVMMVHQSHDYSHLPGGAPHHSAPESDENIRLAGGNAPIRYTIHDATHCLVDGKLGRPRPSYSRLLRMVELALRAVFAFLPPKMIEEVARPRRWKRRLQRAFKVPVSKPDEPNA